MKNTRSRLNDWHHLMAAFQTRRQLRGLLHWARHKPAGLRDTYARQFATMQRIIKAYWRRHPHLAFWGSLVFHFATFFSPRRRARKGSARPYRLSNWQFIPIGNGDHDIHWLVKFSGCRVFGRPARWFC